MSGFSRRSPLDEGSSGVSLSRYFFCISYLHVRRRPAGSGACRRECEQSKESKLLWHLASCPTGTACGDRQPSKLGSGSAMRIGRCGTAAAGRLRGGCGWRGCGAAAGRLWGCGAAAGRLRGGCGAAVGRLRLWGCGVAAHWTRKRRNSRAISGRVGGHSSREGGARKHKNCGIRARRFRVKWGDTPADLVGTWVPNLGSWVVVVPHPPPRSAGFWVVRTWVQPGLGRTVLHVSVSYLTLVLLLNNLVPVGPLLERRHK